MKIAKGRILLLITTLLLCFVSGEIILRLVSFSDLDGNNFVQNVQLTPYHLPILETEKKILDYGQNESNSRLIFDHELGWVSNGNFRSSDSLYIYNNRGIRCNGQNDSTNNKSSIRILLFGDSYMHGDEVEFQGTIGYFLEKLYSKMGVNIEILNFAVSGYGMDQAFLRWEGVKNELKPDYVIFGIQFENAKRNLNLIRPMYSPITNIPFSKPRFFLKNHQLKIIDNPAVSFNEIPAIVEKFNTWEYKQFEYFYNQTNYSTTIFDQSRLISFVSSAIYLFFQEHRFYEEGSDSYDLSLQLLKRFEKSVKDEGAVFIPVHLPVKNDFYLSSYLFCKLFYGEQVIYEKLLNEIKNDFNLVEIYPKFAEWLIVQSTSDLFLERHYSQTTNKLIAKEIFDYLNLNYKMRSEI